MKYIYWHVQEYSLMRSVARVRSCTRKHVKGRDMIFSKTSNAVKMELIQFSNLEHIEGPWKIRRSLHLGLIAVSLRFS